MTTRRDLLIGAGCALVLGTTEYLRPRRVLDLLGGADLDVAIPRAFGAWSSNNGGDVVVPQTEGSLSARLYGKQVIRTYRAEAVAAPVMLVIAYGSTQSDMLQLHRPEACYGAVGFDITARALGPIALTGAVGVPGVMLTAQAEQRVEDIVYWTRLGEYLPQTAGQQRSDRLSAAMAGYVCDGVLVRASMVRQGLDPVFPQLIAFLSDLVLATPPATRRALVGSARAASLAGGRLVT